MRLLLLTYEFETDAEPLSRLREICARHEITERQFEAFDPDEPGDFDAVILIGRADAVDCDKASQQSLGDWLADSDKPVLACGWGFGVFLTAFGFDAIDAEEAEGGETLVPTEAGSVVFQGTDPIKIEPTVRWTLDREELPKKLQVLAESETGIEAARHKSKPLLAIQQLPADFIYPSDSKLVYENLLAVIEKAVR